MTVPYSADAMTTPWTAGLKFQRVWISFSAPEMTTVSKPNRKPASDEVIDHKTMREPIMSAYCIILR